MILVCDEVIQMNIFQDMRSVVVGLLPLLAGCGQLGEALGDAEMDVPLEEQDGGETTKPNGLDPDTAEECIAPILQAMGMPLVTLQNNEEVANPSLPTSLASSCLEPFQYAVRCALGSGATVPGHSVMGEGILTGTSGWRTAGGLSQSQRADVLTCLTVFNNTNEQVPICLQGGNISGEPGDCDGYDIFEAVFLTVPSPVGDVYSAYIWPLFPGAFCQGENLAEILAQRVCGQPWEGEDPPCHAEIRDDFGTACTVSQGEITCWGMPAIRTKLTDEGFGYMYPNCEIVPQ